MPRLPSFAALLVIMERLHRLVPQFDPVLFADQPPTWPTGYIRDRAFACSLAQQVLVDREGSRALVKIRQELVQQLPENQHLGGTTSDSGQRDLWEIGDCRWKIEGMEYHFNDADEARVVTI